MRKIEQQMLQAIQNEQDWNSANTKVEVTDYIIKVYLHNNHIATINNKTNTMSISSAGWRTVTTKSRLNALLSSCTRLGLRQKDFVWYLGDVEFRDWTVIRLGS